MSPAAEDDTSSPAALHATIKQFFESDHEDMAKVVKSHDLISAPKSTIGVGKCSRVRLVEVKALPPYLQAHGFSSGFEDSAEMHGFFALKVMRKSEVHRLKQAEHARNESLIVSKVTHPFIVNFFHRYSDERFLCLVQEFVQCGRLYDFIYTNGRLTNEMTRFVTAQLTMAIQYLHSEHIIYRDLHAGNVMLDRGMYVKLVDFSHAKAMNFANPDERTYTMCGEPEYVAPEIILSKGHGKEVDWWALGVLLHEMLAGYPPWYHKDVAKVYELILSTKLSTGTFPKHFESHASELIKKLLTHTPSLRLGGSKNGAEDIKKHKWFRGLNWAAIYNKQTRQMAPPVEGHTFVPSLASPVDASFHGAYPTSSDENAPPLPDEIDFALFRHWETISSENDLKKYSDAAFT